MEFFDYHRFSVFLLVLLRVAGFFMAFPFFSTVFIPVNVRILLIVAFSFYVSSFVNSVPPNFTFDGVSLLAFFLLVVKEVLLGAFLSLVVMVFYGIVIYAAELISYMMGLTVVNMFDPTFGMVSVIGRFFVFLFYVVFFASGAYKVFIAALVESFRVVPVGGFSIKEPVFEFFLKKTALMFSLGFQLAFPFLVTLFLTNLILALVNRLIPQINVFIVGLPFQIFVGLFALFLGFSVIAYYFMNLSEDMNAALMEILKIWGR